jgi:hypothetical protein
MADEPVTIREFYEARERVTRLEAQRVEDQEAIRLLREGKKDSTGTYIAIGGMLFSFLATIVAIWAVLRGH